jgi:hypothetical protein
MPQPVAYEAFFTLDTGTHNAEIRQLALTRDERHLVSAAEVTIRVWDLKERRLLRRLLGPIDERSDEEYGKGNVIAFTISPDDRWVVALKEWWQDPVRRGARTVAQTRVEIFDLGTGNLHRAMCLDGSWDSLDFSPDGAWLVIAGYRKLGRGYQGELLLLPTETLRERSDSNAPPAMKVHPLGALATTRDLYPEPPQVRFVPPQGEVQAPHRLVTLHQAKTADAHDVLTWLELEGQGILKQTALVRSPQRLLAHSLTLSAELAVVAGIDSPREDGRLGQFVAYTHDAGWHSRTATDAPPEGFAFNKDGTQLFVGLSPTRTHEAMQSPVSDYEIPAVDALDGGTDQLPEHGPATEITELPTEPGEDVVPVHVYAVGPQGMDLRSSYFGHDGTVAALVVQSNGWVWSSGGDNRAIHVWHAQHRVGEFMHALRGLGRTCLLPGINQREQILFGNLPQRQLPMGYPERQQRFDLRTMALGTVCPSSTTDMDFKTRKWVNDQYRSSQLITLRHRQSEGVVADLTLFVAANDEWLIWSPSGFYNASPNGAKLAGYHVNRGSQQEAVFVSADRFKDFYRPDLIQAVVRHGSEARAAQAGVQFPVLKVADMLPPVVEIDDAQVLEGGTQAALRISVDDLGGPHPVARVWILANDRFVWEQRITRRKARHRFKVQLPLRSGTTDFTVFAESAAAKSMPARSQLVGHVAQDDEPAFGAPGRLHLLCVGVSDFEVAHSEEANGFKPLAYAHLDAIAVFNAFAQSRSGTDIDLSLPLVNAAFESVEARLLTNEQATRAAVMDALRELCIGIQARAAAPGPERDVLMVYLSGHGAKFPGDQELFFFNHDMRPLDVEKTGLSLIDLGQLMTSVAADVVLVVDTCYAASAGDDVVSGLDPEELGQRIHALNERGLYVMGAARGNEKARESPVAELSVFTAALLEALKTRRFHEPESPERPERVVRAMGLMHALQALVPAISVKANKKPQTPVCRTYGDLLPLTLYKP